MTVYISADAKNLREELASLRNQGGYQEQQFYFDGLVTNGTLDADTDWTKGTGWTISGGVATSATATAGALVQTISLVAGRSYAVQYEITAYTSGSVLPIFIGGTPVIGSSGSGLGVKTAYITAAAGNNQLSLSKNGSADAYSIDNVSVFEVDANDDVVHRMPKGWKPKDVFEDGLLQREGAAHDYEVVYDGFDYYVKPAVAPSATTQTCVIGVKA
jgi:hypothetical protein